MCATVQSAERIAAFPAISLGGVNRSVFRGRRGYDMRKNSLKNTRINGEVQRVLAEIIRSDIKDPRIHPMTSVVTVTVAPDLKTCKAYISVLGDDKAAEDTLAGLKSASGYIRKELAKQINLRNTPEITFVMDQSIAYGVNMSKKIDEVMASMPKRDEEDMTDNE